MQIKYGASDNCEELKRQHRDLDTASATETFRVIILIVFAMPASASLGKLCTI